VKTGCCHHFRFRRCSAKSLPGEPKLVERVKIDDSSPKQAVERFKEQWFLKFWWRYHFRLFSIVSFSIDWVVSLPACFHFFIICAYSVFVSEPTRLVGWYVFTDSYFECSDTYLLFFSTARIQFGRGYGSSDVLWTSTSRVPSDETIAPGGGAVSVYGLVQAWRSAHVQRQTHTGRSSVSLYDQSWLNNRVQILAGGVIFNWFEFDTVYTQSRFTC
jgi:hypothetical protein